VSESAAVRRLLVTLAVSLSLISAGVSNAFSLPTIGLLLAIPWVVYATSAIKSSEKYEPYVVFSAVTVLQLGIAVRSSVGPASSMHLEIWNAIALLIVTLLAASFANGWLRAAILVVALNAVVALLPLGSRSGIDVGLQWLEAVVLVIAFWEVSQQLVPGLHATRLNLMSELRVGARGLIHRGTGSTLSRGRLSAGLVTLLALIPGAVSAGAPVHGIGCVDVTAATGLRFVNSYGSTVATDGFGAQMQRDLGNGIAVGDYDGDGYLDVYALGQNGHASRLFRNVAGPNGSRQFVDVTDRAGLGGQLGLSRAAFFVDLTGNGLLDLVVINDRDPEGKLPPSKIFRNNGDGTFSDVTAGSGFDPVGYIVSGAAIADYNRDGLPDIYISYWTNNRGRSLDTPAGAPPDQFPGYNRLYKNLGSFHFQDVTLQSGLGKLSLDSFTPIFTNFTTSGYPDLFVPMDYGEGDRYLRNDAGIFHDVSSQFGIGHSGNDMGVAAADLTGRGLVDLFVTNITDPARNVGVNPGNTLLLATPTPGGGLHYSDHAAELGVIDTGWGWGASFADLSLTGYPDLLVAQGARHLAEPSPALRAGRASLFISDQRGHFVLSQGTGCDVHGELRSVLPLDYDRDGAPDFLISQVNGPLLLLHNVTQPRGNWLTVSCRGKGARCLGTKVIVTSGTHSVGQVILAGGSLLAGPPQELYFGVGSATYVDSVRILWPGGTSETLRKVAANQLIRIVAPPVSSQDHLGS